MTRDELFQFLKESSDGDLRFIIENAARIIESRLHVTKLSLTQCEAKNNTSPL